MAETADTSIVRFDDDAEQSVLGAAMMAPKYWPVIAERVAAEDFFRPGHARIFREIAATIAEGQEPDPITLADRLQGDELVEALGGREYLFSLPTVSVATRGPQHADIVHRLAQERKGEHRLAELLTLVEEYIARYVFLPSPEQRTAVVLWAAHTWIVEQFEVTPYLAILSPEKRSGKTRLLDVLELVVARPWRTVTPSEAVLFRKIAADRPTLLFDEIDTIFGHKAGSNYEGVRAILNAGFMRGTKVPRCVGEATNIRVVDFAVYGAKAFAGIGRLPDTVEDRSVIIDMVRRAPDEPVARFRRREASAEARPLREALERWAVDVDLSEAWPEIPSELDDRAADAWEALLAVADHAGEGWSEEARRAARVLSGGRMEETASFGIRLLHDCRRMFDSEQTDRLTSERMVELLTGLEESPWHDLTKAKLAARLKHYKIRPATIRVGDRTAKGYKKEDFKDAWKRYLPTSSAFETGSETSHRNISEEIPANKALSLDAGGVTSGPLETLEAPNVTDANYADLQVKGPNVTDVTDVTAETETGAVRCNTVTAPTDDIGALPLASPQQVTV